jgi:thiol-disulfide isomerase/thioredoxin
MVAMVLGMITTIVLLFALFSEPVQNEKYDSEQLQRMEAREEAARADTLEEMMIKLSKLKTQRSTSILDSVSICQERIDISKQVIERGPSDEAMREIAVSEGLLARVKLYGLDFTRRLDMGDSSAELEAAYTPYLEDTNAKIYSHASVARLTHRSFEKLKSGSDDVDDLVELFSDTINRFPNDEYIASMIEAHMLVLVEKDPRYTSMLFAKLREKNPPGSLDPAMERKMHNIADRQLLQSESFDQKFADRWANGKAGRRELTKTASKLLNKPEIGLLVVRQAAMLAEWFERNSFPDEAKMVFQEISMSVKNGNVLDDYRRFAKNVAESGLNRIGLEGQTIEFYGIDSAGKELIDADLKRKVVVVVYWSSKSPKSLKYLDKLNESANSLRNKSVSILAVCTDSELPRDANVLTQKNSVIQIIEPDFESGKNSLLTKCQPGSLPHVMMIDFGGEIHDVNLDPTQLKNKALSMLMNRNR